MPRDDIGILWYGATDLKGVDVCDADFASDSFIWTETPLVFAIQSQALNAQRPPLNSEPSKA